MGRAITWSKNGKMYPGWRRSPAELAEVRALVHELACGRGYSIRQVRRALMGRHVLRSVGSISHDLNAYECDACASTPARPAEPASPGPAVKPEVIAWQ